MRTRVGVGVLLLAVVAGLTVAGPGVAPASAHQVLMTRSTPSTVAGGATVAATMLLPGTDPGESVHCGGAVLDVDVSVRIRHDDNSQLDVRLEHAGVGRILFLALGGSGVDVRIDDEAPQSLTQLPTNGTPP